MVQYECTAAFQSIIMVKYEWMVTVSMAAQSIMMQHEYMATVSMAAQSIIMV